MWGIAQVQRHHRWLRIRIAATVLFGALLVGLGVAQLLRNTLALRATANATIRDDTYLLRVIDLEHLAVDAETGLRGDVITGRSLFLAPLHLAERRLPSAVRLLRASVASTHADASQSSHLIAAVDSYMSVYVPHVLDLLAHDPASARSFAATLQGKQALDAIRARAGVLEQLLSSRDSHRQEQAQNTANHSVTDAIAALVLLTLLTGLTGAYLGHLAVTRERARQQSEQTAQTLQESILPETMPDIPDCELAVRFLPGEGPVSGDFYDAFSTGPDTWALIIGDVCGKGTAAAAATAMARWTLRSSLEQGAAPAEALRLLNRVMLGHQSDPRFITAACLTLRLGAHTASATIAAAGHPPPVLVRPTGIPFAVSAHGDLLGVFREIRLQTAELELHPGDCVVAYTDGVTDQAPDSRSCEEALREHGGASAEVLAATLERIARRPAARQSDDVAVMALRFIGALPPRRRAAAAALSEP